jgi:tyrosinase
MYEQELQACGYTGAMLYWDWALSASDPLNAPIFTDEAGLGGSGVSSPTCQYIPGNRITKLCVASGPFAALRPAYYQSATVTHSLIRCFTCGDSNMFNDTWTGAVIDRIMQYKSFWRFAEQVYIGPHLSIHDAIGGDFPTTTSPNGMKSSSNTTRRLLTYVRTSLLSTSRPS